MIGNDVISLKHLLKRDVKRQNRYNEKVFTIAEQQLILNNYFINIESLFWGFKESAYKAYFRISPIKIVSPKAFEVVAIRSIGEKFQGEVKTPVGNFYTMGYMNSSHISTFADQKKGTKLIHETFSFSGSFYPLLLSKIKKKLKTPFTIELIKDKHSVPSIYWKGKVLPLSISHDYNIGAYCLYL